MRNINKALFVGRLTRDAEVKYTRAGGAMCKFSVAVNNIKKDGDQWVDDPSFFDCVLFGKLAEVIGDRLNKGCQVVVESHPKQERWKSAEGDNRQKIVFMVDNITLIGGKKSSNPADNDGFTDDIPF